MKVLIENYRNFEIYFDNEDEIFYTVSDKYDSENKTKSYASIKKWIDDFIKDNNDFKPFFAIARIEGSLYVKNDAIKINVIGITKAKKIIYINEKDEKQTLSKYDVSNYIFYEPENEPFYKELQELKEKEERERIENNDKRKEIVSKMKITPIKEWLEDYDIN